MAESDVVITGAVVPGEKSPVLVTEEMVKSMAPGSVIFALAAGEFYLPTPNVPRFMMTAATFLKPAR